ncbi:MAG TPA: MFS transporter [Methylomirabilota bacterium]|nr:MFS transporter [Methylomirabilota bacterium]
MKGSAFRVRPSSAGRRLFVELAASALARFFLNTARRFAYPFGPALARGLDVPLTRITSLVALNQGMGLLSPLLGTLADRWGPRVMMLIGLACLAGGMLAVGVLPLYATVLLALLLAGVGKSCFDPALQAYIGARVPWARRGFAVGLIEFAWAGSSLIGIPTVGWLIGTFGWRSPFLVLGLLALLSVVFLAILLPRVPVSRGAARRGVPVREAWRLLVRRRAALGGLGYGLCFGMANDFLFVIYGAWLELDFRLPLAALGSATMVIGVAELVAESLTAFLSDRVGLARAVTGGVALTAVAYLLLPFVARTLPLALAALFLVFVAFEFTVVSAVGLFTELLPDARGTMIGAVGATGSTGRMLGALLGGYLWLWGGLVATGCVAAALSVLALCSLRWGLRGWRPPSRMIEIA